MGRLCVKMIRGERTARQNNMRGKRVRGSNGEGKEPRDDGIKNI